MWLVGTYSGAQSMVSLLEEHQIVALANIRQGGGEKATVTDSD